MAAGLCQFPALCHFLPADTQYPPHVTLPLIPKSPGLSEKGVRKHTSSDFSPIEMRTQSLISAENLRICPGLGPTWKLSLAPRVTPLRVGSMGSTLGKLGPFYSKAKITGFGAKIGFVGWVPALFLICCVVLIQWHNFSGLQFLHLYN